MQLKWLMQVFSVGKKMKKKCKKSITIAIFIVLVMLFIIKTKTKPEIYAIITINQRIIRGESY